MNNIYLFGECMVELKNSSTNTMQQSYAGDVFNTAVYLKRLFSNMNVNLVTAVGQDHFSQGMIRFFEEEQLGTDYVFKSEDKIPGLYAIKLDESGERSFTYWRNDSAARTVMSFIDEGITETLSTGDIFFFSGISLGVVTPEQRDEFWRFISKLKAAGVKIAFDLNYRPKLWANKDEARKQFFLAFESADILLPGVDDFAQIFDIDDVAQVIEFFNRYDYQELIVKNGEKNVYCLSPEQQQVVTVTPVETVVDTTSAGDSFNGAYLGARMAGQGLATSVELANKVAGFVIQYTGAIVDKNAFNQQFN